MLVWTFSALANLPSPLTWAHVQTADLFITPPLLLAPSFLDSLNCLSGELGHRDGILPRKMHICYKGKENRVLSTLLNILQPYHPILGSSFRGRKTFTIFFFFCPAAVPQWRLFLKRSWFKDVRDAQRTRGWRATLSTPSRLIWVAFPHNESKHSCTSWPDANQSLGTPALRVLHSICVSREMVFTASKDGI